MDDLTCTELSNALYEVSIARYDLVTEEDGGYALCDGERVLASGETMESALTDFVRKATEPCLSTAEQRAQGKRCACGGADDYCPCQNAPDRATRMQRKERDDGR